MKRDKKLVKRLKLILQMTAKNRDNRPMINSKYHSHSCLKTLDYDLFIKQSMI